MDTKILAVIIVVLLIAIYIFWKRSSSKKENVTKKKKKEKSRNRRVRGSSRHPIEDSEDIDDDDDDDVNNNDNDYDDDVVEDAEELFNLVHDRMSSGMQSSEFTEITGELADNLTFIEIKQLYNDASNKEEDSSRSVTVDDYIEVLTKMKAGE